jgi:molybdopterin-guanine dinucleotide biosynthesis protein A
MGGDKAEIVLAGERLVDRAARRLRWLSDDLLVVLRQDQSLQVEGARLVRDVMPDAGALAGIAAALHAARHEWTLLVACDMPFLQRALVERMLNQADDCDLVAPRLAVGLEPLHALYHRRCLDPVLRSLAQGQRRASSFYAAVRARYVDEDIIAACDPEQRSFFNINTPTDLALAREWAAQEKECMDRRTLPQRAWIEESAVL